MWQELGVAGGPDIVSLRVHAPLDGVELWSAESPYLYTLLIAIECSHHRAVAHDDDAAVATTPLDGGAGPIDGGAGPLDGGAGDGIGGRYLEWEAMRLGARTACVSGKQLRINGQAITLKGVNRHEHDPIRGKCVDEASMVRDALMTKPSPPHGTPLPSPPP